MRQICIRHLKVLIYILIAIPQFLIASSECVKKSLPLTLEDGIAVFEKSEIAKYWTNQRLIESLRLIRSAKLRVPENYEYRFYIALKPSHSDGTPIDGAALLAAYNDLIIRSNEGSDFWIMVPHSRIPAFLVAASKPEFARSVQYFGGKDVQGDAKALHVKALSSNNVRTVQIQNSYIDGFISTRGANPPELVAAPSAASRYPVNKRTYVFKRQKFLTFPKTISVRHGFGAKYDRFIQLGAALVLADVLRLNLGDGSVHTKDRAPLHPIFLFHTIADFKINVVEVKKSATSDIPYSLEIEIEVEGNLNSDSYGLLSRQKITAEIEFDGTMIFNPRGGITGISFHK